MNIYQIFNLFGVKYIFTLFYPKLSLYFNSYLYKFIKESKNLFLGGIGEVVAKYGRGKGGGRDKIDFLGVISTIRSIPRPP